MFSRRVHSGPLARHLLTMAPRRAVLPLLHDRRACSSLTGVGSIADETKAKGCSNPTASFASDVFGAAASSDPSEMDAAIPTDLVTENAVSVDFAQHMYGPWLVMTEDLQGELFVDHDQFVFYRPTNGLGYGVGRIEIIDAKAGGTAFTLKLESYSYQQTTTFAPRTGITIEVTGMVKKVSSSANNYETFSMIGIFRRDDLNTPMTTDGAPPSPPRGDLDDLVTGQFNAAKLSPWAPAAKDAPWQPNAELAQVFKEVFPEQLKLTSHLTRRQNAEREEAANRANLSSSTKTAGTAIANSLSSRNAPHHLDLEPYRVGPVPNIYYIPNYISEAEEVQILKMIRETPEELKSKVTKRTVQEWGCTMCSDCEKSFVSDASMPPWVQECSDMLMYDGLFTPATFANSVRIHEYEAGEGIGPHCDGPIYVPLVTVLSLASTSVMNFYPRESPYFDKPMEHYNDTFKFTEGRIGAQTPLLTAVLEPRSLLVFTDAAYYYHPHGVSDKAVDELTPEAAGGVVNRHLLRDRDIQSVPRQYRASLTTRNLLTRCNDQPARVEYNMKRAWHLYNQRPVPAPLFTPSPLGAEQESAEKGVPTSPATAGLSRGDLASWEAKMDRVFAQQEEMKRAIMELKELVTLSVSADAQYRGDTASILNNLTTTVLDIDAKAEDIRDELEELNKKKD